MGVRWLSWRPTAKGHAFVCILVLASPALVALVDAAAFAQSRPSSTPAKGRPAGHAGTTKKPSAEPFPAGTSTAAPTSASSAAGAPGATSSADAGAGVVEAKTLDGGTRAFKFSELDI